MRNIDVDNIKNKIETLSRRLIDLQFQLKYPSLLSPTERKQKMNRFLNLKLEINKYNDWLKHIEFGKITKSAVPSTKKQE